MALVTHQMQGSYVTFPSRPLPWIRGIKLKRYVTTLHIAGRKDDSFLLKRNISSRPKPKALRISAFKGNARNDEPGGRASGSKSAKNSVKLKESGDPITESSKANDVSLSYTPEANESVSSPAIHRLFKKWLTNLRTQSSDQVVDGIIGEEPSPTDTSESELRTQKKETNALLKAVWCHCLSLDATVKIPLLIFIPLYLAVNVIYGAEVSKDLTPLWILGPVILALYIKMLGWLFALYVFSFKQTVKVIKNLPTYFTVAYSYIVQGKLKEEVYARFWRPVVNFKNMNYKESSKRKLKELEEWIGEKFIDFVESIWPYYCRTIRFLKRANLI
ncbi:embryo defective [Parasponia andersonii]|uniref:Embryo defective n=1 Tax=Parasponia andersonii TaxID=3476 RepID=A0A2P5DG21_PARAD|nr:embryo defective [Parasponia andersonii]